MLVAIHVLKSSSSPSHILHPGNVCKVSEIPEETDCDSHREDSKRRLRINMLASWLGPLALVLESTRALQIPFNSHQRTDQVKTVQHSHPVSLDSPLSASGYSSAVARPFPLPIIPPAILYPLEDVKLRSVPAKVWRPRAKGGSPQYEAARQADRARSRGLSYQTSSLQWEEIDLEAPDVTDMDTLAGLAKMTSNAYVEGDKSHKNNSGWYHFPEWELGDSFGWTEDGIRGHVFATENNETIVVAIKGTSAGLVGGGGSTSGNDKTNDNLFFSCW